jgi:hypothetical protein
MNERMVPSVTYIVEFLETIPLSVNLINVIYEKP